MIRVFVSSVSKGLVPVRRQVIGHLRTAGYDVGAMEYFGAQNELPLDVCLRDLRKADVVVLILGPRYGSVLPQGVSYTQAEFREARALGIPVLAFKVSDDTSLSQQERDSLADFVTEVGSTTTYKALGTEDSIDALSGEILAALTSARDRGQLGSRFSLFQPFDRFFAAQLGELPPLYNHESPFVGRTEELERIVSFLRSSSSVLIIKAPGGSGKSRLLLEASKAAKNNASSPEILFVDTGAQWTSEDISRLPTVPLILIIDDAHRRADLDRLIHACLQHNPTTRFIVSCRPSAVSVVQPHVAAVSRDSSIPSLELSPLTVANATELAKYHLGTEWEQLAARLVQISDRNPLVIAVGGRCIAEKRVSPDVLQHSPEAFRTLVLERLLDDPDLQHNDSHQRRQLLELISAVGPTAVESDEIITALATFVSAPHHKIRRMLADLERSGFLARRGRLVRVSPDVLSDHLLYTASVDASGHPTGFIDEMVRAFDSTFLENLLANAAELDWRASATVEHESVLTTTWDGLLKVLPQTTHANRAVLLERLKRAAVFAPEQVLRIAEWIADHRDAPLDDKLRMWGFEDSFERVEDPLADLFAFIARHPDFTDRCIERLWEFAADDDRPTNLNTSHPQRHLEELLKYQSRSGWQSPESVHIRVVDFFIAKLRKPHQNEDRSWAITLLGTALGRFGEANESNRESFTLGQFSLSSYLNQISARREKVIFCLRDLALGRNVVEAAAAIHVLSGLFQVPNGMFGLELDSDELAVWQPEAERAIEIISEIARMAGNEAIRFLARRALRSGSRSHWPALAMSLERSLTQVPAVASEQLFDLLVGVPYEEQLDDYEAEEIREANRLDSAVSDFWAHHKTGSEVVNALLAAESAVQSIASQESGKTSRLLHSLLSAKPTEAVEAVSALVAAGESGWRLIPPALLAIQKTHPADATRLADELTRESSETLRIHAADSLRWMRIDDLSVSGIVSIASRLAQDPSKAVRRLIPGVLRKLREKAPKEGLKIAVSIPWDNDVEIAAAVLDTLHPQYGLDANLLSDTEIDDLLKRIVTLRSLDGRNARDILEFIEFASSKRPASTVDLLVQRVLASDSSGGSRQGERWTPIPHGAHGLSLRGLEGASNYLELLRKIRDAELGAGPLARHWLPILFKSAAVDLQAGFLVLREWIQSDEAERISRASDLLRGFDHSFVFTSDEFIAELLSAAARNGQECLDSVRSDLFAIAISGVHSSAPGQPAPRYLSDKASAQELVKKYATVRPVRSFYEGIIEYAESSIERDSIRWEEEGDD